MNPIVLLRFLSALLVVRLMGRFVRGLLQGLHGMQGQPAAAGPGPRPSPAAAPAGNEMVRDRVCNTFVPRERALRAVVGGVEQHFCSTTCRDRALRATVP